MYSLDVIRKNIIKMFENNYEDINCVAVQYTATKTARRMAECRGLTEGERDTAAKPIARSISEFFWYDKQNDGSLLLYLNYNKRNRVIRPEGRYFSMETCIEFAIASGMKYSDYRRFAEYMMGFSWNYLRNPEYLVGDICLRFGLEPFRYYELSQYAKHAADNPPAEGYLTGVTNDFNAEYTQLIDALQSAGSLSENDIIGEVKQFIGEHTAYLNGNFSRTIKYIRQIVKFPAKDSFLAQNNGSANRLNQQLIRATMSWEYKSTLKPNDGISKLFGIDADPADITISRHTELYCINKPENTKHGLPYYSPSDSKDKRKKDLGRPDFTDNFRFEMANMQVIRNDLVRIMLMNMTDKEKALSTINLALESNSFTPLSDDDPFDYLVKCAIEIYSASDMEMPEEWRNLTVYDILCKLKELLSESD